MREFELLKHVFANNANLGPSVLIPPGDDMGMVDLEGRSLLISVDQLIDGQHVQVDRVPIEMVGRKAITRSLSDVAAMAARPVACVATCVASPSMDDESVRRLFCAMHATANEFHCPLVGGDLAMHADESQPLTCTVTVVAVPLDEQHPPVTRSGAEPGDSVYVTGVLGGAYDKSGAGHHLTFRPRIDEALELVRSVGSRLHAMIDVSDGLGRDASHIAEMSGVQMEIDASLVPCRGECEWRSAISMGEDYELLFAATGAVPTTLGETPVTRIGSVRSRPAEGPTVIIRIGEELVVGSELGWEHGSA